MEKDFDSLEVPTNDLDEIEEKEKNPITVLLGAACQASYRLLQKFGNKKVYSKRPEFAQYYVKDLAKSSMEAHLYIISKKDKFVGRKALYFSLRFIELFIQNKDVCQMMECHMESLLYEYIIPLLSINVQDAVEFKNNAPESIRKELSEDPSHSDNCPKVAARGLLRELWSYIPDKSYKEPALLGKFLHLCVDHLNEFKSNPSIDFRVKDAALFAIYSLREHIEKNEELLSGLEDLLIEHVLWELSSDNLFLRARALLCYWEITSKMSLEDKKATEEFWSLIYNNSLKSQPLNIRVYSFVCIGNVCDTEFGQMFFKNKVGELLETWLDILDEFFIEDLIEALNEIINVFYEEVIPYSIQVWEKLSEAYYDIMVQMGQEDVEMDDAKSVVIANGCLNAIKRLVTSIGGQAKENKKVIYDIEDKVQQIIFDSLDPRFSDVHESVLTLAWALSYYNQEISSNLWRMFPKIVGLVEYNLDKTWEYGLIGPGIIWIMNYMQKDPDTFLNAQMESGETPFASTVSLISKIISDSHQTEDYLLHKTGTDLIISLLENLHGRIDDSIHNILELLVTEVQKYSDRWVRHLIIQAISMCFAYNAALTFQIIEEMNWTQGIFELWFDALPNAKYDFEIKRLTLGLLAIIKWRDFQLPEIVVSGMPSIFKELVTLWEKSLYTREQKYKSAEEKWQEAYEKAYNILDDWSDEDEYDDDDEYDPEESKEESLELYKSFTQEVDEIYEVKKTLEGLESNTFDAYFKLVSNDDQNSLQRLFNNLYVPQ